VICTAFNDTGMNADGTLNWNFAPGSTASINSYGRNQVMECLRQAYGRGVKKVHIVSHSNGLLSVLGGWRSFEPRHILRDQRCGPMTVYLDAIQAAAGAGSFPSRTDANDWRKFANPSPPSNYQGSVLAEWTGIQGYTNPDKGASFTGYNSGLTWSGTSSVGRINFWMAAFDFQHQYQGFWTSFTCTQPSLLNRVQLTCANAAPWNEVSDDPELTHGHTEAAIDLVATHLGDFGTDYAHCHAQQGGLLSRYGTSCGYRAQIDNN
jgi:hypothetical protein